MLPSAGGVGTGLSISLTQILFELKRPLQTVSLRVPVCERRQTETGFNQFQDRGGVVGRVIHVALFGKRRNDNGRDAGARPPAVYLGGRYVIPETAEFVVSDDDGGAGPYRAATDGFNNFFNFAVGIRDSGITGVLVFAAHRFEKSHLRKTVLEVGEQLGFIF